LAVLAAIGLAFYTVNSGGKKKAASSTTTTTTTTTASKYAGLVARTAPAKSADCNTPASGPVGSGAKAASGLAVSIVPAPKHVPFPSLDGTTRYTKFSSAPPFCIDVAKTYTATVKTDAGTFTIDLLPKYAPVTVNNFVFLAAYHYYDGVYFQRVITGFMDQGGDPTGTGAGGPGYTIADEYPSTSAAFGTGAVAMANTGQPNSGGSQFFVMVPGGSSILGGSAYTVFGEVTSGISVVEQINKDGSSAGTPTKYHHIISVSITES
jgi:cyclophilin family peptidyl-prolyl cis-trans isomerase